MTQGGLGDVSFTSKKARDMEEAFYLGGRETQGSTWFQEGIINWPVAMFKVSSM